MDIYTQIDIDRGNTILDSFVYKRHKIAAGHGIDRFTQCPIKTAYLATLVTDCPISIL